MRLLHLITLVIVAGLLSPVPALAARLYLDAVPPQNRLDTFYVPIRIQTDGTCVNALSVDVSYDPTVVRVLDVARGDSILSLWTEEPKVSETEGRVHFAGGIPGGYCGRVEGDPGKTDVLARLVLSGVPKAMEAGALESTEVSILESSNAYLHDGSGMEAPLETGTSLITLVVATTSPENAWLDEVHTDLTAPELFDISLATSSAVAGGKWFIVFATQDKQSGVDHFEVLETDPDRFGFLTWIPRESHWIVAKSPYVLRDQKLQSKIMVKAVDKNGNERTVTYTPPLTPLDAVARPEAIILIVLVLGLFVLGALFVRTRIRHRRSNNPRDDGASPLVHS